MDADTASKFEAIRRLRSTNKQLENERNNVLLPTSDIETVYNDLLSATTDTPVSWLLTFPGSKVCQKLSLLLDPGSPPGWEVFAFYLGLTPDVIRDIKFNKNLDEGPTYTVVWIYAQNTDAKVSQLLEVLYKMKRYDVLQKLHDCATDETELGRNSDEYAYSHIKQLPGKYRLFSTLKTAESNKLFKKIIDKEKLVAKEAANSKDNSVLAERSTKKRRYKAIVMLTFAVDGEECAKRIAAALREKIIGVLILDEHRERLISNPEACITGYFQQVHYVIPIITEGYLRALSSYSQPPGPLTACADACYVKFVYTLMANQYLQNGCINTNVRCILPDGYESLMQEYPGAYGRPILQAWLPEREVKVLAQSILSSARFASEE